MLRQIRFLNVFILVISFFILSFVVSPVFASDNFVIKSIVADEAGGLVTIMGSHTGSVANYKVTKLDNPDRLVIDMPNTVLIGSRQSVRISNSGILNLKISQFSLKPDVVRLVFTADSKEAVKNITFHKSENTLIFNLNKVVVKKYAAPSVYHDNNTEEVEAVIFKANSTKESSPASKSISTLKDNDHKIEINSIKINKNNLVLSGIGSISINEPFVLTNPTRLVIDLPNTFVNSTDVLKTYVLPNTDVIRVAKNTTDTIRVVVETDNPDNYRTVISSDLQTLIISNKYNMMLSCLPDGTNVVNVQNIDVVQNKDENITKITITTTDPIVHNIRHLYHPNRINLELFNVNAPRKALITSLQQTEQFQGINISYIDKYPQGSSWDFPLKKGARIESQLSMDGKSLMISINTPKYVQHTVTKGKVVIDPGHGGTEPGAMRSGIYEKNLTLDVAKKVYKYLSNAGVDVIMTRDDDSTVSLKGRTDITNSEDPDCFVSIHINSCTNPSIKGLETHLYTPQSQELARTIHQRITSRVNSPNRGIIKSQFYVIHHTEVPSILVEIGFISNDEERSQLLSEERQEITANAIADGILQYLNIKH